MTDRLANLCQDIDRFLDTDRKFFRRRPHRKYRIRRACKAEIEAAQIVAESPMDVSPGQAVFTIVRQISEGERVRVFVIAYADCETDLGDKDIEQIWLTAWSAMPGSLHLVEQRIKDVARGEA